VSAFRPAGQVIYDDGVLRLARTDHPPGLVIAGEVDEAGYPALVAALRAVRELAKVHVDMTQVSYCDLAGLRAIVLLADSGPGGRRQVVLDQIPPQLLAVLRIVGWDVTPGLTIVKRVPSHPGELA
jgi:ABC-type transporter Mla MlaB component